VRRGRPQIEELLTHYGPIAGIWFDTPGPITPAESRELVDLVHRLQPECLVNSRIGNGLGDYDTLGDQEIPRLPRPGLWETPDTHNDTWAYSRYDTNWKSAREIAERLVRVVSRGGTYLLNVGPDGKGRIPEQSARILREVGHWVRDHEQAVHGAGPSPLGPLAWGECTTKGNALFLHVFQWPRNGRLIVPGMRSAIQRVRLHGGEELTAQATADGLTVALPQLPSDTLIPVIEVALAGPIEASRDAYVLNGCANTLDTSVASLLGDWKLRFARGGAHAEGRAVTDAVLHDLSEDPAEEKDLSQANPEKKTRLFAEYQRFIAERKLKPLAVEVLKRQSERKGRSRRPRKTPSAPDDARRKEKGPNAAIGLP